jgi:hypothetical protein
MFFLISKINFFYISSINFSKDLAFKRETLKETDCKIEMIKLPGTIEEHKSLENFK